MMDFSKEERILMMLYSPGTRPGLIAELEGMKKQLGNREKGLRALTDTVLEKLDEISDEEFLQIDLLPDL